MSAIVLHRSPIPATAARLEVARCCPVGRHDRASASRTPGSHLRRAVELPPLPTNPTIASAPQSASFVPQSTIDAVLEYHQRPPLPSKLLRGYLLPLFELEPLHSRQTRRPQYDAYVALFPLPKARSGQPTMEGNMIKKCVFIFAVV